MEKVVILCLVALGTEQQHVFLRTVFISILLLLKCPNYGLFLIAFDAVCNTVNENILQSFKSESARV